MTPHLSSLFEFLRFQSVSADSAYSPQVNACAQWLVERFRAIGLEASSHPTEGHPIVLARNEPKPGRRTVLIYGHYDVQPVDPLHLWTTPPFEPRLEDGLIYARGSADNKGQIMAHILGVEKTLREKGDLPVNLIFLVEGEEEIGSSHLEAFLSAHRESLQPDVIAISDTGMISPDLPAITYGLRGIASLEVRLKASSSDLHSGTYGGIAPNPALLLARMIATLHDENLHVTIPGFYDDVRPLEAWEREEWARLPTTDDDLRAVIGAKALLGEAGYTSFERLWGRPTAELNGIGGGYQGEGTKTVIPAEAFAKFTFRLVPDQTPAAIAEKIRAHFESVCPPEVDLTVSVLHGGEPFLSDPQSADGQAARRACHRVWNKEPALIRQGGSIPILQTFQKLFEKEILLIGLAQPGCNAHAPNENFLVKNFEEGIALNIALLEELAAVR